jgi:microsomal epoxide hydrolase
MNVSLQSDYIKTAPTYTAFHKNHPKSHLYAMTPSFATLPATARSQPTHFHVSIPDKQLDEFRQLLKLSKIGPKTFETEQDDGRFGITRDWLVEAKAQWELFNWSVMTLTASCIYLLVYRQNVENEINSFPNFKIPIRENNEVFDIHFVALFSQKQDAIPVLLLHGWPGNFMEFFQIIKLLSERYSPETLPYHFIVPSLPGFAFSSPPPLTRDFQLQNIASIMNSLMIELGFQSGYAVQGGDIGSKVCRVMAATYDAVKAIHSMSRYLNLNLDSQSLQSIFASCLVLRESKTVPSLPTRNKVSHDPKNSKDSAPHMLSCMLRNQAPLASY